MNTTVKTFRAATTEEAMAQVRHELGMDAVVVEVKQIASRGLLAWISSKQGVEVTASPASRKRRQKSKSSVEASRSSVKATVGTIAAAAFASSTRSRDVSLDPAKSSASENVSAPVAAMQKALPTELSQNFTLFECRVPASASSPVLHAPAANIHSNRRPDLANQVQPISSSNSAETWRQSAADSIRGMNLPLTSDRRVLSPRNDRDQANDPSIVQRLDALQQMIAELGSRSHPHRFAEIPPELFPHYLTLVEADVEDDIARELILKVQRQVSPGQLADTSAATALLTVLIEQRISCAQSLSPTIGRRQIVAVVGPTGVGKTTTLAKLAGTFGMHQGLKLGLITIDTYRVAAVEQLRTYAEIIDLPMRVVAGCQEIQEALDSMADRDLILIDTAGLSPQDNRGLADLSQLIDSARPDHVYLVLSLASGAKALRTTAERFASVRPTSLVFTKLDEATGCGGLVAAARDIGLPISYFTTGQEVPRDIEPANPCRAARLILRADRVARTRSPLNSEADHLLYL